MRAGTESPTENRISRSLSNGLERDGEACNREDPATPQSTDAGSEYSEAFTLGLAFLMSPVGTPAASPRSI